MTSEQIEEQAKHEPGDSLTWKRVYNDLDENYQKALFWIVAVGFGPIFLFNPLDDSTTGEWVWGVGCLLFYIGVFGLLLSVDWIGVLSDIGVLAVLYRVENLLINVIIWFADVLVQPSLYLVVLLLGLTILVPLAYKVGWGQ